MIRDAKSNYYKHVINQNYNNSSKLWKTPKTVLPKKCTCTPLSIVYNDNVLTSNKDISNGFNMDFAYVATKLIDNCDDEGNVDNSYVASCMSSSHSRLNLSSVTPEFVDKQIEKNI